MSIQSSRLVLIVLAGGLAAAGCSQQPTRPSSGASTTTTTTTSAPATHAAPSRSGTTGGKTRAAAPPTTAPSSARNEAPAAPEAAAPAEKTGIQSCDDYLASYIACHRVAGIFPPEQIEGHYETMRDSLLRDAQDPDIRPQLNNRCASLAGQLRQVLHGKSCNTPPPAPARSGS